MCISACLSIIISLPPSPFSSLLFSSFLISLLYSSLLSLLLLPPLPSFISLLLACLFSNISSNSPSVWASLATHLYFATLHNNLFSKIDFNFFRKDKKSNMDFFFQIHENHFIDRCHVRAYEKLWVYSIFKKRHIQSKMKET